MTKPITPDEVGLYAQTVFPAFVFQAVNDLLSRGGDILYQNEIIDQMIFRASEVGVELDRNDVFAKHYLDFEEAYRAAGWNVSYDKPAYYENYEANFKFKRKK